MMKFTRDLLSNRNQKGIAIILAVFTVVLIVYLVTEITYETNVEYQVHAASVNRLKAYYAAKSGVDLSLLRIKIYKKIHSQFGKQLGPQASMLNLIWSFPLSWPPVLPDAANGIDKDSLKSKLKESQMEANFNATIFDEGSKIDINDLNSPAKGIRDLTKKQILKIFENQMETDREWAAAHADFRSAELVNNIIDWLDSDTDSLNSGNEAQFYKDVPKEATPFPPNRNFRTMAELRMVAGMTDDIYKLLEDKITVFGAKAINPNTAAKEVLKALDSSITDEVVKEILEQRDDPKKGTPFTKPEEFWSFVNSHGGRVDADTQKNTPLTFEAVTNFRIRSIGEYNGAIREITAIVMDVNAAAAVTAAKVKTEKDANNPNPTPTLDPNKASAQSPGTQNGGAAGAQTPTKGPPRIVYWYEK